MILILELEGSFCFITCSLARYLNVTISILLENNLSCIMVSSLIAKDSHVGWRPDRDNNFDRISDFDDFDILMGAVDLNKSQFVLYVYYNIF